MNSKKFVSDAYKNQYSGSNYEKVVNDIYQEILLRSPDKPGLDYFIAMLKNKKMTPEEIRKIVYDSDEAKSIRNFSHYTDKYWNDLDTVKKYKNKLATDNENLSWIDDIPNRFKKYLPFDNVLIVGCGNGWLERKLYDMGIGKNFDAFDISEDYIKEAKEQKGSRTINYFIDDINEMRNIDNKKYDAVFNFAILHHTTKIENSMKKLSEVLKPNALMFNEEYVGPAQNQYSDEHIEKMKEIMGDLPQEYRTKHQLRPPIINFRVEPTEAIHSDLIRSNFEKNFNIVYQRNLNGGIAYQILWNNIDKFEDKDNPESQKHLNYLLEQDFILTKNGQVPVLFWYGVGKPKRV